MHRVSVQPVLAKWEQRRAARARAEKSFDLALLEKCDACRACRDDCPVAKVDPTFEPDALVAQILHGELEDAVAGHQAWKCLECYTCLELCPSRIGLAGTLRALKEQGREHRPAAISQALGKLAAEGVLGRPRGGERAKLGLPDLPPTGGEALRRLLTDTNDAETRP
jgi:heterodisulfide reductase subunit C